jgi:starch phosphorylase
MEIALDAALPTYSGGLGVLAGDTLRAAADMALPVCAVTLLYRKGYFRQHLDAAGKQTESAVLWNPDELLEPVAATVGVKVEGRDVRLRAYRYTIKGAKGHQVPVYFLDAHSGENGAYDQTLTDHLYGGDERYRLCQETVLGMGGVALLEALGHGKELESYHMNEGHAAL